MMILSSYFDALLAAAAAAHTTSGGYSGPLYNLQIALLSAGIQLAPSTPWSQMTEANFSGYVRATGVTWGNPILQSNGSASILSALETFIAQAASNFIGNLIYGYAVVDASNNVYLMEMFDNPIPVQAPSDGFGLVLAFNVGANMGGSYSQVIAAT